MIENMIYKIREKIEKEDFQFSDSEIAILSQNIELIKETLHHIGEDFSVIKYLFYDIKMYISDNLFEDLLSSLDPKEIKSLFYSLQYGYCLKFNRLSNQLIKYYNNEEYREEILSKVMENVIKEKSFTFDQIDNYFFKKLLSNNRLDIINRFSYFINISAQNKKEYVEKCLANNIQFNVRITDDIISIKKIYRLLPPQMLLNALLITCNEFTLGTNEEKLSVCEEILDYLLESLPHSELEPSLRDKRIMPISSMNILLKKFKEKGTKLIKILEEKGEYYYGIALYDVKEISQSKNILDKILTEINNKSIKKDDALIKNILFYNWKEEEKEKIFLTLINNGFLNIFLENTWNWFNYLDKYKNLIIKNIQNGLYKDELKTYNLQDDYTNEIFLCALDNKAIENIIINVDIIDTDYLREILDKLVDYKINITTNFIYKSNKEHDITDDNIQILLEYGYVETVIKSIMDSYSASNLDLDFKKVEDQILPYLKNNLRYALSYIKNYFDKITTPNMISFIRENSRIFYPALESLAEELPAEEQDKYYTDTYFELFKNYISKSKNISLERLEIVYKIIGPTFLKIINSSNMNRLFHLEDKEFYRFIKLISDKNYNHRDLEKAYISIKESTFRTLFPDVVEIGTIISKNIESNNHEDSLQIIRKISNSLDYHKFLHMLKIVAEDKKFKDYSELYNHPEEMAPNGAGPYIYGFLSSLYFKCCKDSQFYKDGYIELLREIIKKYIDVKRGEFIRSESIADSLKLSYDLDENDKKDKLIKYIVKNDSAFIETFIDELNSQPKNDSSEKELYKEDALQLIEVIKGNKEVKDAGQSLKKMRLFRDLLYERILDRFDLQSIIELLDKEGIIKRIYKIDKKLDIVTLLSYIDFDLLKNSLTDDDIYKSLLELMQKRKIHLLPLTNLQGMIPNIDINETTIAAFLSFYHVIYSELKEQKETTDLKIARIIEEGDSYAAVSSIFSLVLTPENMRLIKSNPGTNRANKKIMDDQRLKEAVANTKLLYEKKSVTVPTSNDIKKTTSGKEIRCMIGNFTSPTNLTHGERTDSCMRIGGAGEDLFDFVIQNKNGFHIEFRDPKTNKYISRVSGFRNGNTVFLNELRRSLLPDIFTNEDLYKIVKQIAEDFIIKTKNSKTPIENVFITESEALEEYKGKKYDLTNKRVKQGYKRLYSDYNRFQSILLATTASKDYVPFNFYQSEIEEYEAARDIVINPQKEEDMLIYINRVETVKRLLNGDDYREFNATFMPNGYLFGYANHDWYIYVDNNYVINSNYTSDDISLKREFDNYMEIVKEKVAQMGSVKHEI